MAQETITSFNHFQQLWNRQNELRRKNTQELKAAVRRGDSAARKEHVAARKKLRASAQKIEDAESAFLATNRSQSDAEKALIRQTRQANDLVRKINNAAKVLDGIAKFAGIVGKLVTALT